MTQTVVLNKIFGGLLYNYGLIDNEEKVAASRKHIYPIQDLSIQEVNNTEETGDCIVSFINSKSKMLSLK